MFDGRGLALPAAALNDKPSHLSLVGRGLLHQHFGSNPVLYLGGNEPHTWV